MIDPMNRPTRTGPPTKQRANSGSASIEQAGRDAVRQALREERSYLKFAFTNPYNLTLLGGALAAAALTLNPVLAVIAAGVEGLWLLHAPTSRTLRRLIWDPQFERLRQEAEEKERARRLTSLSSRDRERVEALVDKQHEINRLAGTNPSFTSDLLRTELSKTGKLVDAFIDMAVTCARYEEYLESIDLSALERDRARWEREVRGGQNGDPQTEIAKKNFAIILKRIEKMREIQKYLKTSRSQLDLLENSFQLIADQIVTMQSPQELSGQLDELLEGVESIRQTAVDTEKMLATLNA
jgi:hypothetical protein